LEKQLNTYLLTSENKNQNIQWQDIAGMRDKLIHHYFSIDFELIWQTIIEDLPILFQTVTSLLNDNK
jgi:uncharacterized protein with HEPN domain